VLKSLAFLDNSVISFSSEKLFEKREEEDGRHPFLCWDDDDDDDDDDDGDGGDDGDSFVLFFFFKISMGVIGVMIRMVKSVDEDGRGEGEKERGEESHIGMLLLISCCVVLLSAELKSLFKK
jgi:hypothetical protein